VTVVKVEVGFSGPGVDESFKLDSATRGLLGTARLGPFDTLVDLSERVRSLSVSRGRPELTEPVTVGRAQIVLDNLDGALDPQNTSSVLYPGVQPRRSVRLFCDDEQVFDGFAETIALDYTLDGDATVVVSAQDGLSRLGIVNLPSEGLAVSSESSGARISSVLASNANYWTEGTNLAAGDSTLAAGTATGNVLQYLRTVESSEAGLLFASRTGDLTFRNRNNPGATATIDLADDGSGVEYEQIERVSGADDLFNLITAQFGTATVVAQDADSEESFGVRQLDLSTLLLDSEAVTQDRVEYELVRRKNQLPSVRSVQVSQERQAALGVLSAELGDRVEVVFSPPGVGQLTQISRVIGVGHRWTVGVGWRTVLSVRSLESDPFFVLDDTDLGRLNTGRLAF
jgi:hypothetical protein